MIAIKLKMIRIFLILLLFGCDNDSQGADLTPILSNMNKDWSIGNGCDEHQLIGYVNGDLNTNGYKLELMNTKIVVHGQVNGEYTKKCGDNSIIEQ